MSIFSGNCTIGSWSIWIWSTSFKYILGCFSCEKRLCWFLVCCSLILQNKLNMCINIICLTFLEFLFYLKLLYFSFYCLLNTMKLIFFPVRNSKSISYFLVRLSWICILVWVAYKLLWVLIIFLQSEKWQQKKVTLTVLQWLLPNR